MAIFFVAKHGSNSNNGTEEAPFLSINHAAQVAQAGDTVIVKEGIYRESVVPARGGLSNTRRITYKAAQGDRVTIKGSEVIKGWNQLNNRLWQVVLPNSYFGEFNPYSDLIDGDWLTYNGGKRHTGDVYLNGLSFYEVSAIEDLENPVEMHETLDHRTRKMTRVDNPYQTTLVWHAEVDENNTTISANFQGNDPNIETVEINVRRTVFYPDKPGCNYITVSGFEMAQAATPWTPPTADQPGLIGVHWSKGWIIENNIIHDSKCSGISIGKEITTGHNYRTIRKDKPGYLYQQESVFSALKIGWSQETIGSHIIRNNTIYDCGQNGIVGHLGCIFSTIENNHIYNIALKREFYGHEIGAIKLHAPIDTVISNNHIHDCSLGVWLDWQSQGTRISGNLLHRNNRDIYIEVTHGPHLVDNNIFGSKYSFENHAQGGAFINNLFAGRIVQQKILDRFTPYHWPHTTDIRGYTCVYGGDDRYYQNIFIGTLAEEDDLKEHGTAMYDAYTSSWDEYIQKVDKLSPGDHNNFNRVEQPVYISNNLYFNKALPYKNEKGALVNSDHNNHFEILQDSSGVYLVIDLPEGFEGYPSTRYSTSNIPSTRISDTEFDNRCGGSMTIDSDFLGETYTHPKHGPIHSLKAGKNKIKLR